MNHGRQLWLGGGVQHSTRLLVLAMLYLLPQPLLGADLLEEIVVTARRLPEPLADVPLAVSTFDSDQIAVSALDSMQALISRAPGFYYETMWGGLNSTPNLRGQQPSPSGDLNVGVFVDGVYQANPSAVDPGVLDIERVEIVPGPQSTLFGHSTFAGAIHYVTRAPSITTEYGYTLDAGSDNLGAISGFVSGPLTESVLARAAVELASFDGTHRNAAPGGGDLDGWTHSGMALALATPQDWPARASFTARFNRKSSEHPAVSALTFAEYDCGAVEPASGAWSYYCGKMPVRKVYNISPGIPDSESNVSQAVLVLSWPVAGGELESRTSVYRGSTDSYRDFDVSSDGETYGVCTVGVNCDDPAGIPRTINRLVMAEEVLRSLSTTTEWSQEFRWQSREGKRLRWMLGVTAWSTRISDEGRLGVAKGDLAENERMTALLPQSPFDVGPVSLVNEALVSDPDRLQRTRAFDESERQAFAVFGTTDYMLTNSIRARAELRFSRERRALDNRIANFEPGFGTAIPAQHFNDITPRLTIQRLPTGSFGAWLSAAKGSQSGGINPIPGLPPDEQVYDPEYNWTYELGISYRNPSREFGARTTFYYIDWRDMQLLGFPDSPGIANLITRNTKGLETRGLEISLDARLHPTFRAELDLSYTRPAFRTGSDEPGSRRFCGVSSTNSISTFCTIGPARSGDVAGLVPVPYIDGNLPARTPQKMWHAAVVLEPPMRSDHRLTVRIDASGQDDVFDRAIGGAHFGKRTLLDSRVTYQIGNWTIALWGRNLGDKSYVRAVASRGQVFFPTTPRPLDMIYGEGRRIGLSVSFGHHLTGS